MSIFNPDFQDIMACLNQAKVEYMMVGEYAVIIRGYSRSTGDMNIWINKTESNFIALQSALLSFGLPLQSIPNDKFFSDEYDVFSFGKPPYAIEILTALKGISSFEMAFCSATMEKLTMWKDLIQAKEASGRHKDKNDIENLSSVATD